jgi:hypothetical protein
VLGFGALVRPELLLLGGLVCARLWLGREDGGRVRFILAWLAPVLLWSAIAYHAFGAVVPTTLQAKSTPIGLRPARFVNNLVTLLSLISVGAGLTLVGMVPTLRRLRRFENWNWLDPVLLLWLVLLPCIYLVKDVTLVSRYLEILLPVLLLLSCQGLATMRWQSGARAVVLAELVLSLGMSMLWIAPSVRAYSASAEITLGRIADWLRENTPRDDLVAIYDIGLVGYRSHRTILDLGGLVHPGINRLRNRVDDELILREGLFLRFATPQWLVDRRETPRALDGGILGRFRLQAVLDGEVSNLGLMHPEPVYYTLYRLLPLSD